MTASPTPQLTVILGSVTKPGRLRRALVEALGRVPAQRASTELIDLAEVTVTFADGRRPEELDDDCERIVETVTRSDAVVIASPIYRSSLTGALKNLLDHIPVAALRDTPTGIVAMGGSDHHYLGAQSHLRDILAWFGALTVPTAVYLTARDFQDGVPGERAGSELDQLIASALDLAAQRAGAAPLGPVPFAGRAS